MDPPAGFADVAAKCQFLWPQTVNTPRGRQLELLAERRFGILSKVQGWKRTEGVRIQIVTGTEPRQEQPHLKCASCRDPCKPVASKTSA